MKNLLFRLLVICSVSMFILVSCDTKEDIGKQRDTIGLSVKNLLYGIDGGIKSVTTDKGDDWLIGNISVNGEHIPLKDMTTANIKEEKYYELSKDWLHIERRHKELVVTLDKNKSGQPRKIEIYLSERNYFDKLTIEQE